MERGGESMEDGRQNMEHDSEIKNEKWKMMDERRKMEHEKCEMTHGVKNDRRGWDGSSRHREAHQGGFRQTMAWMRALDAFARVFS